MRARAPRGPGRCAGGGAEPVCSSSAGKAMVCFGSTFIELPKAKTEEMLQKGTAGCARR